MQDRPRVGVVRLPQRREGCRRSVHIHQVVVGVDLRICQWSARHDNVWGYQVVTAKSSLQILVGLENLLEIRQVFVLVEPCNSGFLSNAKRPFTRAKVLESRKRSLKEFKGQPRELIARRLAIGDILAELRT